MHPILSVFQKGEVNFDKPEWCGNDIKSDIADDFYIIAKSINSLTKEEKEWLYCSYDLTFEELNPFIGKVWVF